MAKKPSDDEQLPSDEAEEKIHYDTIPDAFPLDESEGELELEAEDESQEKERKTDAPPIAKKKKTVTFAEELEQVKTFTAEPFEKDLTDYPKPNNPYGEIPTGLPKDESMEITEQQQSPEKPAASKGKHPYGEIPTANQPESPAKPPTSKADKPYYYSSMPQERDIPAETMEQGEGQLVYWGMSRKEQKKFDADFEQASWNERHAILHNLDDASLNYFKSGQRSVPSPYNDAVDLIGAVREARSPSNKNMQVEQNAINLLNITACYQVAESMQQPANSKLLDHLQEQLLSAPLDHFLNKTPKEIRAFLEKPEINQKDSQAAKGFIATAHQLIKNAEQQGAKSKLSRFMGHKKTTDPLSKSDAKQLKNLLQEQHLFDKSYMSSSTSTRTATPPPQPPPTFGR